jgi:hypothetical protein
MVLDEIVNAVSQMAAPIMTDIQSGRWGQLSAEGEYTRDIAVQLGNTPNRKIWTARGTHELIPNNEPENSYSSPFFLGHSKRDICWAEGLDSENPTEILEVKLRSSAAPSQDHYRFFSEVCAVAADVFHAGNDISGYCIFITDVGERERTRWFNDMTAVENMRIELEPSVAIANAGPDFPQAVPRRPYWIDQQNGLIRPNFRSAFNKIFCHTTDTHYVGLFRREGLLRINCTVTQQETDNGYWIIQYRINDVELSGTDLPLNEWWP